jgi:hypothetical protein
VPERERVGVLVPNLFLRTAVETAIREQDAQPVSIGSAEAALAARFRAVVIDLDAAGTKPSEAIRTLARAGITVLAFGPGVDGERLAAARLAGAVALPRPAFLARLPELLALALPSGQDVTAAPDSGPRRPPTRCRRGTSEHKTR